MGERVGSITDEITVGDLYIRCAKFRKKEGSSGYASIVDESAVLDFNLIASVRIIICIKTGSTFYKLLSTMRTGKVERSIRSFIPAP